MWNIFLNQWLSIFFYMLVFVYSSKSILILWMGRMINTRIIRWILADILTISIRTSKVAQFKKICIFFYSETNHNIPWYEPILTRLEASFLAMRIQNSLLIIGCNSMMNDYILISTLTEKNPNRWMDRNCKIQEIVYFSTLYLDHSSWNFVHTR